MKRATGSIGAQSHKSLLGNKPQMFSMRLMIMLVFWQAWLYGKSLGITKVITTHSIANPAIGGHPTLPHRCLAWHRWFRLFSTNNKNTGHHDYHYHFPTKVLKKLTIYIVGN